MSDERKAGLITLTILAALSLNYLIFGPMDLAVLMLGIPLVTVLYFIVYMVISYDH